MEKALDKTSMEQQKVIFVFEDGSKRYASHEGKVLQWDRYDIAALQDNIETYGMPAMTSDFTKYDVNFAALRERYHFAHIVRVVDIEFESCYCKLQKGVEKCQM